MSFFMFRSSLFFFIFVSCPRVPAAEAAVGGQTDYDTKDHSIARENAGSERSQPREDPANDGTNQAKDSANNSDRHPAAEHQRGQDKQTAQEIPIAAMMIVTEEHFPQKQNSKQAQHCNVPPFRRFTCTGHYAVWVPLSQIIDLDGTSSVRV
jgi:hypothetical protein